MERTIAIVPDSTWMASRYISPDSCRRMGSLLPDMFIRIPYFPKECKPGHDFLLGREKSPVK
jgi:hypothetical protein